MIENIKERKKYIIGKMNFYDLKDKMINLYCKIVTQVFHKHMFLSIGRNSKILKPMILRNTKYMSIGSSVTINRNVFLLAISQGGVENPKLTIDNGTTIGNYNHITCCNEVYIGKNVLTADRVYISDNCHEYENIDIPISHQGVYSSGKVIIGDETWIGENVCIISSKIGRHCVIGANSVITKDIPDFCVAVGAPARIIKKYNLEKGIWEKNYD